MPVDTSVYGLARPAAPMGVNEILGAIGQINNIRQFGRQWDTDTAIGDAVKRAGGDPGNALSGIVNDPRATGNLLPAIAATQNARTSGYTADTAQLARDAQRHQFVRDYFASHSADPNFNRERFIRDIPFLARNTAIPIQELNDYASNWPTDRKAEKDYVKSITAQALGSATVTGRIQGVNPQTGATESQPLGAAIFSGGGAPATGAGGPTAGSTTTSLPPGAEPSIAAYQQDLTAAGQFPTRTLPLKRMIEILHQIGPQGTGPLTAPINEVKALAVKFLGLDPKAAMPIEQLKKYMIQNATRTGLGDTNEQLGALFSGNPNIDMTQLANIHLAKGQMAQERFNHAMVNEAQAQGVKPWEYNEFKRKFAASADIRAFGYDMLSKGEQQKFLKGLSTKRPAPGTPSEYERFVASLGVMKRAGLNQAGLRPSLTAPLAGQ
jgi:hypothetical protein